jgi:signal transduction histidine kinase
VHQAEQIAQGGPGAPIDAPVVHELQQLSSSLSRMAAELRARTEYIRSFAASVSHEFKTPLASIQGAVELLRDEPAMAPGQRARFLANVDRDARRLTELVRRLLELARADAAEPSREQCGLRAVLQAAAARARAEGALVQLAEVPEIQVQLPASVLDTIVAQLLANARQHGGDQVRVQVEAQLDGPRARVVVRDDGRGIAAADRARVFEPFFTTARERGGTGLGLTIARSLLRPFGGTLELSPTESGTAFEITALVAP